MMVAATAAGVRHVLRLEAVPSLRVCEPPRLAPHGCGSRDLHPSHSPAPPNIVCGMSWPPARPFQTTPPPLVVRRRLHTHGYPVKLCATGEAWSSCFETRGGDDAEQPPRQEAKPYPVNPKTCDLGGTHKPSHPTAARHVVLEWVACQAAPTASRPEPHHRPAALKRRELVYMGGGRAQAPYCTANTPVSRHATLHASLRHHAGLRGKGAGPRPPTM